MDVLKEAPLALDEKVIVAALGACAAISTWSDLRADTPMTPDERELLWQRDRLLEAVRDYQRPKRARASGNP